MWCTSSLHVHSPRATCLVLPLTFCTVSVRWPTCSSSLPQCPAEAWSPQAPSLHPQLPTFLMPSVTGDSCTESFSQIKSAMEYSPVFRTWIMHPFIQECVLDKDHAHVMLGLIVYIYWIHKLWGKLYRASSSSTVGIAQSNTSHRTGYVHVSLNVHHRENSWHILLPLSCMDYHHKQSEPRDNIGNIVCLGAYGMAYTVCVEQSKICGYVCAHHRSLWSVRATELHCQSKLQCTVEDKCPVAPPTFCVNSRSMPACVDITRHIYITQIMHTSCVECCVFQQSAWSMEFPVLCTKKMENYREKIKQLPPYILCPSQMFILSLL